MNNKVHVKTDDTVVILTGRDRGKKGKVLEVSPKEQKVIVEGCNIVSKHIKPRQMGQQGGIVKAESPIYSSKVQLVCPKCKQPTRIGHKVDDEGKKERQCKKCGATF